MVSRLILFMLVSVSCLHCINGMTKAQLKKTLSIMKNKCITKNGVTEEMIGNIDQGQFLEERNVMCYVACIYQSIQVVKNNKLNKELILKQIDILYPQDMRAGARESTEKCYHVQDNYNDVCEAIYHATKCIYEDNPDNFVFP